MATNEQSFVERREGDTWVNALIGALVAIVLSFTVIGGIISTIAGGTVAGYLQGTTRSAGAKVGALSGIIAGIPVIGVLLVVLGFLGIGLIGAGGDAIFGIGLAGFLVVAIFAVVFVVSVALAAVGGFLGAVLAERRDVPETPGRRSTETVESNVDSSFDTDVN